MLRYTATVAPTSRWSSRRVAIPRQDDRLFPTANCPPKHSYPVHTSTTMFASPKKPVGTRGRAEMCAVSKLCWTEQHSCLCRHARCRKMQATHPYSPKPPSSNPKPNTRTSSQAAFEFAHCLGQALLGPYHQWCLHHAYADHEHDERCLSLLVCPAMQSVWNVILLPLAPQGCQGTMQLFMWQPICYDNCLLDYGHTDLLGQRLILMIIIIQTRTKTDLHQPPGARLAAAG